ncbi:MAG TPA: CHAT domain-containing protein [Pyrinomonadaceae bacterium]|nr:CHAT domain-containing protein [Pyrinomonadaceae bacterium]
MYFPNSLKRPARILPGVVLAFLCLDANAPAQTINTPPAPTGSAEVVSTVQNPLAEASALEQRVLELHRKGKYEEALPLAERALQLREAHLEADHMLIAASLEHVSMVLLSKGEFDRAESLLQRSLKIREKFSGPDDYLVGVSLNSIAQVQMKKGDYARALETMLRSLALREKLFGGEHSLVAHALANLAPLYQNMGRFKEAESCLLRALKILEKPPGISDKQFQQPDEVAVQTGQVLNNLATLYQETGDYVGAEKYLLRSLALREQLLGRDHPHTAITLNNLATLYRVKGDLKRAEGMLLQSLEVLRKAHKDDDNLDVAALVNNLADVYRERGEYARAEELLAKVLEIRERVHRGEHPDVALSLNNLASLYAERGDGERAGALMRRALLMYERLLGAEHPDVGYVLNNLGMLSKAQGDYNRAEEMLRRALEIRSKALGGKHPDVAATLNNLASLYESKADAARAVEFLARGNDIREHNLALILATGSDRQKQLYLATLAAETFNTISLHVNSAANPEAARLALTTILRRKGRALDAMSAQVASLRARLDPQDRALLDKLSAVQSKLSALVLNGTGTTLPAAHATTVSRLEDEVERLQDAVSRRSAEFRIQTQPVTVEQVRGALPVRAALVEFFSYRPNDAKAKTPVGRLGAARYVAYVLRREGDPLWVDLGEAASIDADIARFLTALKCPQTGRGLGCPAIAEVKRLSRAVDERVMRPVRNLLGKTQRIFVSPDGALNLVPFAALVAENDKYLVESYSLTYLTSGRDLLRLQFGARSRQPPLVVANPAFDGGAVGSPASNALSRLDVEEAQAKPPGDTVRLRFVPLRGTAEEAKELVPLLAGVRVLTQARATEAAVKGIRAPQVLHIATHGFFLDDQPQEAIADVRGIKLGGGSAQPAIRIENPLLRSGLALEGANQRRGADGEDGILTALEVAGLDLWGTKLVVLSACETGVGEVRNGEGVYGLRRALVLAGSESQVMSLWQVSDDATLDLMVAYYKRLLAGEGRTGALRQVQLEMIQGSKALKEGTGRGILGARTRAGKGDRRHPFYWAAFIQSGEWRAMTHRAPAR